MKLLGRILITAVAVALALVVIWNIWIYYEVAPRTRDGHIAATVVTVAPKVSGEVVKIAVRDNQTVKKGDLLYQIDPQRYRIAVAQAQSALEGASATLEQARRDSARYQKLNDSATTPQQREQASTSVQKAEAAVNADKSALDLAKLNLSDTQVRAPVNGNVTNLQLGVGDYVGAGTPVMAVVDRDSYYIVGYFEETKLSRIAVGDKVKVWPMGGAKPFYGHVTGVAAAIPDGSASGTSQLLPNVSPTFSWVRLAQRVPVRIAFDDPTVAKRMVAGRTVSIDVLGGAD